MMGLALEHDAEFKAHFLERICGLKDLTSAEAWQVAVEPENWGDLVLKNRQAGLFVVAEFKITAKLADHQDPSKSLFDAPAVNGQCAGYGWEISRIAEREPWWKKLKYVTVERRASYDRSAVRTINRNLVCVPAEWHQLLRTHVSQESSLEADLYDCLSRFGVSIFITRRMRKMKLATHATEPMALLIGVLAEYGANSPIFRRKLLDVSTEALGINMNTEDFPELKRIVEPAGDTAGWFGYESNPPLGQRLSVWFYCDSSTGKGGVKDRLRKAGFTDKEFCENGDHVSAFCKAEDSTGDAEWFAKVLNALNE